MIRDFAHTLDTSSIRQVLTQFQLTPSEVVTGGITLLEFKVLTPDSFVWRFLISGVVYYLYAEDFIEGLDDIHSKLKHIFKNASNLEFVETKTRVKFETADPRQSSGNIQKAQKQRRNDEVCRGIRLRFRIPMQIQ